MKHIYFIDDRVDILKPLICSLLTKYKVTNKQVQVHLIAVVQQKDVVRIGDSCQMIKSELKKLKVIEKAFDYKVIGYSGSKADFYCCANKEKTLDLIFKVINMTPYSVAIDLMLLDTDDLHNVGENKRILSHDIYNKFKEKCILYSFIEDNKHDSGFENWKKLLNQNDIVPTFYITGDRNMAKADEMAEELYSLATE